MKNSSWKLAVSFICFVCVLVVGAKAFAVPASPKLHTLSQPDGSAFSARLWGDERTNGWETGKGYTLVKAADGYWVYAAKSPSGGLVPTKTRATAAPPPALTKGLRPSGPARAATLDKKTTVPDRVVPPTGTANIPVILINYTDTSTTNTAAEFNNLLFGTDPPEATGPGSMRQYYEEVSYGAFSVSAGPSGVAGWYAAANIHHYYGETQSGGFGGAWLAKEAAIAADAAVDFSQYDMDSDGAVDVLMIVHQGRGTEESGDNNDIWSHSWDFNSAGIGAVMLDGVWVNDYVIQPERSGANMVSIGVFCHEYGHALGMPDLYDVDYSSAGVGFWCAMASGSWNGLVRGGDCPAHMSAWIKSALGWLTPAGVTGILSGEAITAAYNAQDVYRLLDNPNGVDWIFYTQTGIGEYFLVENRFQAGFDQALPNSGLAIWHVAEQSVSNNNTNVNEAGVRLVDLEDADGLFHLDNSVNNGDAGDVWPGSAGRTTFNDASAPGAILYDSSPSNCSVANIGASGPVMTADLACFTPADADADGILDDIENLSCSDMNNPDSDGDGLCDGNVAVGSTCVAGEDINLNGSVDQNETNPCNTDSDSDGINDTIEKIDVACLDPANNDTDSDGILDGTSAGEDINNNGVVDPAETDPCNPDTDGGGEDDGCEVGAGRDPLVPADDVVSTPENAVHDAGYSAPRCSTGASPCNVPQSLIDSRDTMATPEPNQPNAINTSPCADGTSGTYHVDESIDSFTVTKIGCGGFSVGDQVRVDANVWCWGTADDYYYVYHADSTVTPVWTLVGQGNCPASGAQTVSATFNLGPSVGDQAVRVVFGYNEPLATSCGTGSYTDHDDVVLGVAAACADIDGDGYGDGCAPGADACDGNQYAWTAPACVTCIDGEPDGWRGVCDDPAGYNNGVDPDCDDADDAVNPGQAEVMCNLKDDDCDGATPDDVDVDVDGLSYCDEIIVGSSDSDPDSDDDGVNDGDEVNVYATDPLYWDTDGDGLPDKFEIDNIANPGGALDPDNALDGPDNFDADSNENVHEYWNNTDPWNDGPAPSVFLSPACYYFGEGDGDGVVGPGDLNMMELEIAGVPQNYSNIIPQSFDPMDLDKDGVPGPGDLVPLELMITQANMPAGYDGAPVNIGILYQPGGPVAVGDTTHITLSVENDGAPAVDYSSGFAMVYWIESGSATLLGGEGEAFGEIAGNRYDMAGESSSLAPANIVIRVDGESSSLAPANIVIRVDGPGPITINAKIPACGTPTTGRWADEVMLGSPIVINP